MMVQHKDYEAITALEVDDPLTVARDEGLVGEHSIETRRRIGAWRWPLLAQTGDVIRDILIKAYNTVDFGGSAGPVGYGTVIVDRIAEIRSLAELPREPPLDAIVTIHTLEHIPDVWLTLVSMLAKLRPNGVLVAMVPSYESEDLRADRWPYHAHTFRLAEQDFDCLALDTLFEEMGFTVCGTGAGWGNIIVIGQRPTDGGAG